MPGEHADNREERIGRIVNDYLDRAQRGEAIDERALLEDNPDIADELCDYFGTLRQVTSASATGGGPGDVAALPHDALPGYEIRHEIHRGGQGVVYQALQKATRRQVAVKVMREGPFAGWRDRARFDREVQVLGALNHPGIVAIHDTGIAFGCHYFVMDYVRGVPLNMWQETARHGVEEILRLFVRICDAVNAAHVKGIIHRDLKPGNIRIDEDGQPRVLDFGLAKTAADREQDEPAGSMTAVGQFVGSLPWTSPEQAQGKLERIDTRTDVYALGVILYQMLAGRFPYDVTGPMRDVLNRIVGSDPARLSSPHRKISRDLEAIVLRCLQKEPHRRYQNAGELGRDLERYLAGEPVVARGDSNWYLLRKTLRRHRIPVGIAAAFVLLVTVSLVTSLSLWREAAAERDRAIVAERDQKVERQRADDQARAAEAARSLAERERVRAQQQAERLRRTTYLGRIALAENALEQQSLTRAQRLLELCPADLRGWEWRYLWRLSHRPPLIDVAADDDCVATMAVSPAGDRLVTGGCDGVIRIWDTASVSRLGDLEGHGGQVNAVAFSPDGEWIASGGRDKTLRLWNARTGEGHVLQKGEQYIYCLAFSPDGKQLAAGGQSRTVGFWSVADRKPLYATTRHAGEVSCVAYSPDGKQVASGEFLGPAGKSAVRTWDASSGKPIRELTEQPGSILRVAYSPDGRRIAVGSGVRPGSRDTQGTLRFIDATSGEEILSLPGHEGFVEALAFNDDGTLLATAGMPRVSQVGMEADGTLKIWNVATGSEVCTYSAHAGGGRALAWSADGRRVFSAGMDGRLKTWPASAPPDARVLRGHTSAVLRLAFSPDGERLASAGGQGIGERIDNRIRIWDVASGRELLVLESHLNAVLALDWSADGRWLASGGMDRTICVWNARTGERQRLIGSEDGMVKDIAFAADGDMFAAVAGGGVGVWRVSQAAAAARLYHGGTLQAAAFSPDGTSLLTAAEDGSIVVWDVASAIKLRSFNTRADLVRIAVGRDFATMATAHGDGSIHVWDVRSGRLVGSMQAGGGPVQWLDLSPDGQRIASCAADMLVRIWDVPGTSEVYRLWAHDGSTTALQFAPDGSRLATCGQDGLIKLWDAPFVDPATRPAQAKRD